MASTLYHMDVATLFVGDDDPRNSQFITLRNVKIPALTEKTKDHTGGGAMSSLELGMGVFEAFSLDFSLEGFNPDVMKFVGQRNRLPLTIRGNVRDVRTHENKELRAIVQGKMVKYEPSQFERDSGMNSDYQVKEIVFYHLFFAGQEKVYFDYFTGPAGIRIDGTPVMDDVARNLGMA